MFRHEVKLNLYSASFNLSPKMQHDCLLGRLCLDRLSAPFRARPYAAGQTRLAVPTLLPTSVLAWGLCHAPSNLLEVSLC